MTWDLTTNPFETLTRRRFTAMDTILADHANRCAERLERALGDQDLKLLHQRAIAARAAWNVIYVRWSVGRRTHKGRTFALSQLIADLRGSRIPLWQVMIQRTGLEHPQWMKGGGGFEALFPDGRRPFQQGGVEARIAAVSRLTAATATVPELAEVHTAAHTFLLTLTTARTLQQEARGSTSHASGEIERQRKDAALVLYRNMARLMEKYAESPASLWHFFDRKLLARAPVRAAMAKE